VGLTINAMLLPICDAIAMLHIGLTGGIGSGKSSVAKLFAELGAPIIDADEIAREVVLPGSDALQMIQHYFGNAILNSAGELNRMRLRNIIFHDAQKRLWLENLLHPLIIDTIKQRTTALHAPYVIIVIPLLIETNQHTWLDRVIVVDLPEDIQLQRLFSRDQNNDPATLRAIHAAQLSRAERLSYAQDIIENSGDFIALAKQVEKLHRFYNSMK